MADERYKWLNRVTAERLLRGESLEAVDASARDQAERLARTLGALSARATPASAELPGEEAALAAFRKARESAEDAGTGAVAQPWTGGRAADAGLFRIGAGSRPNRVPGRPGTARLRPARLGLAAALTVGMLGGVAVAAGTGVLPTPFDDNRPGPAASVSAAGTPARPDGSSSPESLLGGESATPSSGATSAGSGQSAPGSSGRPKNRDSASPGFPAGGWSGALTSCRAIQNGKTLGADRKRALEGLAGGPGRVNKFCKAVLGPGLTGKDTASGDDNGSGNGGGSGGGSGGENGGSGQGGQNGGQGDGSGQGDDGGGRPGRGNGLGIGGPGGGKGDSHGQDGMATPAPTAFSPRPSNQAGALPSPTYSAL
ncbi:hypothetical protein [Streptomyces fuscichromogenes]|uniref:Uncharacterized protein n=1 Tax=Streptomyces fuscichromogenes TaxID=1324013 RepID=A0A917XH66_9ACTN|nr:hypothetical protein [Streptomyces fuscichromogenes]GGN24742.1 hypothetical protein GCM10011578_058210 [Streptomyces fuscichromogenes]